MWIGWKMHMQKRCEQSFTAVYRFPFGISFILGLGILVGRSGVFNEAMVETMPAYLTLRQFDGMHAQADQLVLQFAMAG